MIFIKRTPKRRKNFSPIFVGAGFTPAVQFRQKEFLRVFERGHKARAYDLWLCDAERAQRLDADDGERVTQAGVKHQLSSGKAPGVGFLADDSDR